MRVIPTFNVNGLIDSGKTSYIKDTIYKDGFCKKGKTLLIVCEFGEVEYELDKLNSVKTVMKQINCVDDLNEDNINYIVNEVKPNRIVIEMNCMWDTSRIKLPKYCVVYQQISLIDASTFTVYFNNMRQKVVEIIKDSEIILFNRCYDEKPLVNYKRWLMMSNKQAMYAFMREDGSLINRLEDDLPYNINSEIIELHDSDYTIWYIDSFDNLERYLDKLVNFDSLIYIAKDLPENSFIPGRQVMNCCANDIQFYGHLAYNDLNLKLKKGDWYNITAKVTLSEKDEEGRQEIILHPTKMEKIEAPANPVVS